MRIRFTGPDWLDILGAIISVIEYVVKAATYISILIFIWSYLL